LGPPRRHLRALSPLSHSGACAGCCAVRVCSDVESHPYEDRHTA
jgi:hypothetical protein